MTCGEIADFPATADRSRALPVSFPVRFSRVRRAPPRFTRHRRRGRDRSLSSRVWRTIYYVVLYIYIYI